MDKYSVKLMTRALQDLDDIYAYIANTLLEEKTALKMVDELANEIYSLEQMPNRCPERRQGTYAGRGYRQLFVKNYTIIYRVNEIDKQVIVVTIRYSKSHF